MVIKLPSYISTSVRPLNAPSYSVMDISSSFAVIGRHVCRMNYLCAYIISSFITMRLAGEGYFGQVLGAHYYNSISNIFNYGYFLKIARHCKAQRTAMKQDMGKFLASDDNLLAQYQ
jgi:hypothetical protein